MSGQLPKGYKLGQYEILEPLGKGGMASVYKAHQSTLEREVAIKIMAEQYASDPSFVERFRREARAIARLRHPNILTVYDADYSNNVMYIVMELIEGPTLKEELQGKPMSLEKAGKIIDQISGALHYANGMGIIHRDVKPSNVLIDQKTQRAVLSDFGIAKMAEAKTQLTSTGTGVGTPDYMSPEQAMGEDLDARSDEYSLAVMLYEMLTGRPPFTGDTPIAVVMGHVSKPLPSPRQYNPDIPASVEQVINKALSKKPVDRYADCAAFNEALQDAIKNRDRVQAGPVVTPTSATQVEHYAGPRPGSGSYQTVSNPEADQMYGDARRLEQQNNFLGAFDAFTRLNSRFPNYRDVPTVLERYRVMGYGSQGGPSWGAQVPSGSAVGYRGSGAYGGPAGTSAYYTGTPAPQSAAKSKSSLPLVLGIVGALAVAAIIVLVILLAAGGGNKTPTPVANTTRAGITNTAVPNTTGSGNTTTTRPATTTVAPNTTRPATTNPPVTTRPVTATSGRAYPGSIELPVPDALKAQLAPSFGNIDTLKVEAFKSAEDPNKIKSFYLNFLQKDGWKDASGELQDDSLTQLEDFGAFVLAYEKGADAVAVLGLPGSLAGTLGFTGLGQKDTLILVFSGKV
jgi:serine/threonine-protein kinase